MRADRAGTIILLIAAVWMAALAYVPPGDTASTSFRILAVEIGVFILILAIFPAWLNLTGTVLAFTTFGLALHIGLFGIFGFGLEGLPPAILVAIALSLRRDRLDQFALIPALLMFSLALWTPFYAMAVWLAIAVGNLVIRGITDVLNWNDRRKSSA